MTTIVVTGAPLCIKKSQGRALAIFFRQRKWFCLEPHVKIRAQSGNHAYFISVAAIKNMRGPRHIRVFQLAVWVPFRYHSLPLLEQMGSGLP